MSGQEQPSDTSPLPQPLASLLQRIFSPPGKPPRLSPDLATDTLALGGLGQGTYTAGQWDTQFFPSSSPEVDWTGSPPSPQPPKPKSWQVLQMGEWKPSKKPGEGAPLLPKSLGMRGGLPEHTPPPPPQLTSSVGSMHSLRSPTSLVTRSLVHTRTPPCQGAL